MSQEKGNVTVEAVYQSWKCMHDVEGNGAYYATYRVRSVETNGDV